MQPTTLAYDSLNQLHLLIDPIACLQQAQYIPYSCLIRCKYCHSCTIPVLKTNKSQCSICRCLTQLPNNYCNLISKISGNYILTNQEGKKMQQTTIRILVVCQSLVGNEFANGMLCLKDIFKQYRNIEIGMVTFDKNIKIMELEEDGRVIVVNQESLKIINEKFYACTQESIDQFFNILNSPSIATTMNPTTILQKLLPVISLSAVPTTLLFLADLPQKISYHTYPSFPNIDIYCIFRIPYKISIHSQISALNQMNKHSNRVKYIVKGQNNKKQSNLTQIVHYQLYQIFWKEVVGKLKIQASRQRKYPPQILTRKQRIIGSLGNWIIVRLGKNYDPKQNIQIRISYEEILKQKQIEEGQDSMQKLLLKQIQKNTIKQSQSQHILQNSKLLLVSIALPDKSQQHFEQSLHYYSFVNRYLHLFKLLKLSLTNLQISSLPINNQIDIQICQFLRECSYLQKSQLQNNIENCHCIYAVWPWIGIKYQQKQKNQIADEKAYNQKQQNKVKFIYYFTGYHIPSISHTKKINFHKQNGQNQSRYFQQISNLNDLCQKLYSNHDKILPLYYENLIQQINIPVHLVDSDQQLQKQVEEANRYYQYKIK